MARAKFLVDAERCIECNACVTACKNEHEVPWGINRRKVVTINDGSPGRTLDLGGLHALFGRALHGRLSGGLLLPERRRRGPALEGPLHRLRLLLLCVPLRRAAVPAGGQLRFARQDGQMYLLRRRSRRNPLRQPNSPSTGGTGLPRASCRSAPRCVRPRPFLPVTETWSRASTASASWHAASARVPGAGGLPMDARTVNTGPCT